MSVVGKEDKKKYFCSVVFTQKCFLYFFKCQRRRMTMEKWTVWDIRWQRYIIVQRFKRLWICRVMRMGKSCAYDNKEEKEKCHATFSRSHYSESLSSCYLMRIISNLWRQEPDGLFQYKSSNFICPLLFHSSATPLRQVQKDRIKWKTSYSSGIFKKMRGGYNYRVAIQTLKITSNLMIICLPVRLSSENY